jgi:nitrite reductase/ring-hydroxylating ferredoxin subunit
MPENSNYWRGERGYYTNYWGVMNIAKTKAWATGSGRVPTQSEPVGPRAGNDAPVKPSEFASSQYCADLRAAYSSYEEYLEKCYAVVCPQKYGCFALPDGAAMAERYARKTAPTKDGGNKYKYPALYYGYNRTYGVDGLDYGDWHLPGVLEGTELMKDACLAALAPSITKMGTTAINNSTSRWFAQRYSVNSAWIFYANYGRLGNGGVYDADRSQAVALLKLNK